MTESFVVRAVTLLLLVLAAAPSRADQHEALPPLTPAAGDWPWWRGPTFDGVAPKGDVKPPTAWSDDKNVLWKTPIPGRGHSTPTLVGNFIFLQTCEEDAKKQSVLAFDRKTGEIIWKLALHVGHLDEKTNKKNTHASSTIASDGERLFTVFLFKGELFATALDFGGKKLWQTKVGDFTSHWGYCQSPSIYKSFVLISGDHKGGGYIAALHRKTGEIVWKTDRPKWPNYTSPVVFNVAGKEQLLMAGCELFASYNPKTGERLWETKGTTQECVGTAVISDGLVFASGGWPDNITTAFKADTGEIVWKNKVKVYVPSLLTHQGHVYAVTDNGVAYCWDAKTGEEKWSGRLKGGYSASPILYEDLIYIPSEQGVTTIFKATPADLEIVAENKLGDEAFTSPVIVDGKVFLRVAKQENGKRQEYLYCIGAK